MTTTLLLNAAAGFGGPRQFRQFVVFAYQCALERRPFADAEEATGSLPDDVDPAACSIRWSTGPAGKRASKALDAAMSHAYRDGQIENARHAVDEFFADNPDRDFESACIAAACATEGQDGDYSTLITATDIVDLIGQHMEIADREDAKFIAECALRDFHVGWPEPTPDSERARADSVAEVEAHLARIAHAPDPFDPAQRPPLPPSDPIKEAAFKEQCRLSGEACTRSVAARAKAREELREMEAELRGIDTRIEAVEAARTEEEKRAALAAVLAAQAERAARAEARQIKAYLRCPEMPTEALEAVQDVFLESRIEAQEREEAYWAAQATKAELTAPVPDSATSLQAHDNEPELAVAFDLTTEPGLLGDIARWSQTYAYRPVEEFALPAALATLSALFGRHWATPTGLGLNLYLVGLGDTTGGKDALLSAPRALLDKAGFGRLVGKGDFASDSAIEKELRLRPAQLMPLDEFGKLAQAMMGRQAPPHAKLAAKALLEIHPRSTPNSVWTGKARAGDVEDLPPIHSPTLSLLGVSTVVGFFDGISEATLDDGFLNRLTVIRGGKAGQRQRDPARLMPPPELVEAIRTARAPTGGNLASVVVDDGTTRPAIRFARWADDSAIAALESIESWEDDARDSGRSGVAGRAAEQVQKISTLRALARNPADPAVTAADVQWAWAFVRTSIDTIEIGAREMMAGSDFEALVQAIERAVVEAGPEGIAWSKMLERKGVGKHLPQMIDAAVKRLIEREIIYSGIMNGPKGGRPGRKLQARCFQHG